MATDINEQVSNAYNAAKQALNDDLKQDLYNATTARTTAFRQINNTANAKHALYSGTPAGAQMQYDSGTYLPGIATAAQQALKKFETNQETWDEYMDYVGQLNEQANYYNNLANELKNKTGSTNTNGSTYTNAKAGYSYDVTNGFAGN